MRRRASDIARGVTGLPYLATPHYTSPSPGMTHFGHASTVPQVATPVTTASYVGTPVMASVVHDNNNASHQQHPQHQQSQNGNITSLSPAVSRIINSIPPSVLSARVRTLAATAMASSSTSGVGHNHDSGIGGGAGSPNGHPSELAAAARALRAAAEANDDDDSSAGDEHRKMRKNTRLVSLFVN
jgi:hypothetical protein